MKWDSTLDSILERICKKHDLELSTGKNIITHFLNEINYCIGLPEMPKILIRGFGTFLVSPNRVSKALVALEKRFKKGSIDESFYKKRKKEYISIIERRRKESDFKYKN